jgi:hypothetical protein
MFREGVQTPYRARQGAGTLTEARLEQARRKTIRLFRRNKSTSSPCPRCSQLLEENEPVCPLCGWDQRDAYQGPRVAQHRATSTTESARPNGDSIDSDQLA